MLLELALLEHLLVTRVDDKDLTESSGVAASVFAPDEFWTHNDSGDGARLFRFNQKGEITARVKLDGAKSVDWEDMAVVRRGGSSTLYVADVGDNARRRKSVTIYSLPEPRTGGDFRARALELVYPDGPRDCESIAVDPKTGTIYLVEKTNGASGVYAVASGKLKRVGEVTIGSVVPMSKLATGAAFSPDGKWVVVRGYLGAFLFAVPAKGREWWRSTPTRLTLRAERQGEAICFSRDSRRIFTTSEGRPCEVSSLVLP